MRISQFQKYSQKENTVTNNVLLMLSRLNDLNVLYFKAMIERLNEGSKTQEYNPQAIFSQQKHTGNGVIDGHIEVKPSKILIETKLSRKEFIGKLVKYGQVFKKGWQNQLWHLSSDKYSDPEITDINTKLKELYDCDIQFNSLLFTDLIDNLEGIYEENTLDMELKLLFEDFQGYCYEAGLVSNEEFKLLFAPTGFSYQWNMRHKIYYCPKDWHSQKFKYFGLYNWKSVRSISEIETKIEADFYAENQELVVKSEGHTTEQIERLRSGLIELGENHEGLKYYLFPLEDFHETDFKKNSHGGIQGYRYKDLRDFIDMKKVENTEQIAKELKNINWR